LKVLLRHEVVSGEDASFVPLKKRQMELVEKRTADWAETEQSKSPRRTTRVNMTMLLAEADNGCTIKVTGMLRAACVFVSVAAPRQSAVNQGKDGALRETPLRR
jgi:hypothetical protein